MLKTKVRFLVALRKDEMSDWGAEVVGLPVFSVGSTQEEALKNLKEAIKLYYEDEDVDYEIPVDLLKTGEYDDAVLKIVEVEF